VPTVLRILLYVSALVEIHQPWIVREDAGATTRELSAVPTEAVRSWWPLRPRRSTEPPYGLWPTGGSPISICKSTPIARTP